MFQIYHFQSSFLQTLKEHPILKQNLIDYLQNQNIRLFKDFNKVAYFNIYSI